MAKIEDLTRGSIRNALWKVSLPLIASSFVQTAYTITDMFWLGHVGSKYVAAVGAAGFFIWIGNSISLITKTGAEVLVSQALGAKDKTRAISNARNVLSLSTLLGLFYSLLIIILAPSLISMFNFEPEVAKYGIDYLRMISPGIFFIMNTNTISGIYNSQGNSRSPFLITSIGLLANMILDPILINGLYVFSPLRSDGAAIATTIAQAVVFMIFYYKTHKADYPLGKLKLWGGINNDVMRQILIVGSPTALQSGLFAIFSLTLSTFAAKWGHIGVSAQSIGSQIESVSWMTAQGFSTALCAFVGQNYGGGLINRVNKGYYVTMQIGIVIGIITSGSFIFFGYDIFASFMSGNEQLAISEGGRYLMILGYSQLFMITEIISTGAFNGLGKTQIPSIISIIFTGLRIPLAMYLCSTTTLGLAGIWWAVSISSVFKGIITPTLCVITLKKVTKKNNEKIPY